MEGEFSSSQSTCRGEKCRFFGSTATGGFCSVCFKKSRKEEQLPRAAAEVASSRPTVNVTLLSDALKSAKSTLQSKKERCISDATETESSASADRVGKSAEQEEKQGDPQDEHQETPASKQVKKNRCFTCRKKLGLLGFDCRCGYFYCGQHRYSDAHNCSFDYRALGAQQVRNNNPVIKGVKIQKI